MWPIRLLFKIIEPLGQLQPFEQKTQHLSLSECAILVVVEDLPLTAGTRSTEGDLSALHEHVHELEECEVFSNVFWRVEVGHIGLRFSARST